MDFEDPETQKIRRDFEMYKLNKENELQHIQKKLLKFETENRRLRAEVQVSVFKIRLGIALLNSDYK